MERLAKAVLLAAKLREDSFDLIKANKMHKDVPLNYSSCYKMTIREAADKAAEELGYDSRGTEPIYLLLTNSWNSAIDWAYSCETPDALAQDTNEILEPMEEPK